MKLLKKDRKAAFKIYDSAVEEMSEMYEVSEDLKYMNLEYSSNLEAVQDTY